MRAHSLVLLGMVGAFAGCHDDNGGADLGGVDSGVDLTMGDQGPPDLAVNEDASHCTSATMFHQALAAAICSHLMTCGRLDAANMQACIERNTPKQGIDEDTEIAKGRLCLNDLQCIPAIMNARCDGEDLGAVFIGKCAKLLNIPKQPANGTSQCIASAECINGYCAQAGMLANDGGVPPQGCVGVCVPFKSLGDSCVDPTGGRDECNEDVASCDGTTNKCVARVAQAGTCTQLGACQAGLYCAGFFTNLASPSGKCTMPTGSGNLNDACDAIQSLQTSFPACAVGLFCKPGAGASPVETVGTCQTQLASGATCVKPAGIAALVNAPCADGTVCYQTVGQVNPTCQAPAALNAACDTGADSCKETLYCDGTTKVCKAYLADNQACDPTATINHCLAGSKFAGQNNCLGTAGNASCVAEKAFNDPCSPATDSTVCGTGLCGSNNRCSIQCM